MHQPLQQGGGSAGCPRREGRQGAVLFVQVVALVRGRGGGVFRDGKRVVLFCHIQAQASVALHSAPRCAARALPWSPTVGVGGGRCQYPNILARWPEPSCLWGHLPFSISQTCPECLLCAGHRARGARPPPLPGWRARAPSSPNPSFEPPLSSWSCWEVGLPVGPRS